MRKACVALGWAWAAAIAWLSLAPSLPPVELAHGDKLGHLAAYGLLMFWFAQLYAARVFYAAGFVAMGVALEFLQAQTGYRSYEVLDMAANTLGVLLGWTAALPFRKPLLR
jgi:VanZ family protein